MSGRLYRRARRAGAVVSAPISKTRKTALLVILLLAAAACSGIRTAQGRGFAVHSPFGSEATSTWRTRVEGELAATAAFLGYAVPDPPIDVWLDPVEAGQDTDEMSRLVPSVDGALGFSGVVRTTIASAFTSCVLTSFFLLRNGRRSVS